MTNETHFKGRAVVACLTGLTKGRCSWFAERTRGIMAAVALKDAQSKKTMANSRSCMLSFISARYKKAVNPKASHAPSATWRTGGHT